MKVSWEEPQNRLQKKSLLGVYTAGLRPKLLPDKMTQENPNTLAVIACILRKQ